MRNGILGFKKDVICYAAGKLIEKKIRESPTKREKPHNTRRLKRYTVLENGYMEANTSYFTINIRDR